MSERVAISKKLRFEVFKRDSFTCQYCGAKAPDVILHVDHINPVSKGGGNDILNLVTACSSCNGGKSDRLLSDRSEIEKQRAQLEELNARREQLEAMIEWRSELEGFEDQKLARIADEWNKRITGYSVNDNGLRDLRKWEKRFGTELLLDAIKASADQYLAYDTEGTVTAETVNQAFHMIPRVAAGMKTVAEKPYMRDVYYVRAVLRNRLNYINEKVVIKITRDAIEHGVDIDWLRQFSKEVRSWSAYAKCLYDFIEEQRGDDE